MYDKDWRTWSGKILNYNGADPLLKALRDKLATENFDAQERVNAVNLATFINANFGNNFVLDAATAGGIIIDTLNRHQSLASEGLKRLQQANEAKRASENWANNARNASNYCMARGYPGGFIDGNFLYNTIGIICTHGTRTRNTYAETPDQVSWTETYRRANGYCNSIGYGSGYPDGNYLGGSWGIVSTNSVAICFHLLASLDSLPSPMPLMHGQRIWELIVGVDLKVLNMVF